MCCEDCTSCSKYCLCCCSLSLAAICWAIVVMAIWAQDREPEYKYEVLPRTDHYPRWAIAVGLALFIVFMVGCIAPIIRSRALLIATMVLLTMLVLIEIGLIITLLVKSYDGEKNRFDYTYALNAEFAKDQEAFHRIEEVAKCCGVTGIESYGGGGETDACCDEPPCAPDTAYEGCDTVAWAETRSFMQKVCLLFVLLIFIEVFMIALIWRQLCDSFYLWAIP